MIHLAQELLMNIRCSGGSRILAKEARALKMRSAVAGHQSFTVTNWEGHQSCSSYTTREVVEELKVSHSMVIWHWKQIGKVKKLDKWVGTSWAKHRSKKIIILKCRFFLILHNNEPLLHWVVVRRYVILTLLLSHFSHVRLCATP